MRTPPARRPDAAALFKTDLALQQVMVVLKPLVRWLLRSGVTYMAVSQVLKAVFLEEGRRELQRTGGKCTDSALSLLSGVHRKGVRAAQEPPGFVTVPARVVGRWLTQAAYRQPASDRPLEGLPRLGSAPSFEALAREVCNDMHPRTVLEEMVRLGLVVVRDEQVMLLAAGRPGPGAHERKTLAIAAANAADHLAAAVHNLTVPEGPRFLEQAVFAHGLTGQSAQDLGQFARELWRPALTAMIDEATRLVDADKPALAGKTPTRMRFGVYFYQEDETAPGPPRGLNDRPASPPGSPAG
jgi:hypothetical protein